MINHDIQHFYLYFVFLFNYVIKFNNELTSLIIFILNLIS